MKKILKSISLALILIMGITLSGCFNSNTPPSDITYTISVSANNNSYGSVSGGGTIKENNTTQITATPKSGYVFVRWNDGNTSSTRTVTATQDKSYTATFHVGDDIEYYNGHALIVSNGTINTNYSSSSIAFTTTNRDFGYWSNAQGEYVDDYDKIIYVKNSINRDIYLKANDTVNGLSFWFGNVGVDKSDWPSCPEHCAYNDFWGVLEDANAHDNGYYVDDGVIGMTATTSHPMNITKNGTQKTISVKVSKWNCYRIFKHYTINGNSYIKRDYNESDIVNSAGIAASRTYYYNGGSVKVQFVK